MTRTTKPMLVLLVTFLIVCSMAIVGCSAGDDSSSEPSTNETTENQENKEAEKEEKADKEAEEKEIKATAEKATSGEVDKFVDEFEIWANSYSTLVDSFLADPTNQETLSALLDTVNESYDWMDRATEIQSKYASEVTADHSKRLIDSSKVVSTATEKLNAAVAAM